MPEEEKQVVRTPCPWCKYATGCPESEEFKGTEQDPCDFRSLPYEESAIIEKAKQEIKSIKAMQETLTQMDSASEEYAKLARTVLDKTAGIRIMTKVLHEQFNSDKLQQEVLKEMTFMEKVRLAIKLQELKNKRGGK